MRTATSENIQLQSIGRVPAVPLSDVQPGDTLMWNFGHTTEVVSVTRVTAKTWELVTRVVSPEWAASDTLYVQRKRGTTLVCRVPAKS